MRVFVLTSAIALGALLAPMNLWAAAPQEAPATLHVVLPENAVLTINGARTNATSSDRWFITPALENGKAYVCTLQADFVRDGRQVRIERKVVVRAGSEQRVTMDVPISQNAIYRSFYDGSSVPQPAVRTFAPPAMPVIEERQYNASDTGG